MIEIRNWLTIPITFLVAFMLTLLPMPDWTVWMRPSWVVLVLLYWVTVLPYRVSVGTAWVLGIFLDVLNGTLLGEHALALTIVAYLALRMHSQFRMYPVLQQGLFILLFVWVYQFVLFCVQGFVGDLPKNWLYWSSAVTSMLLWPWVFAILQGCRRRFRVV